MAQAKRNPRTVQQPEDFLGSPEDQKAIRDYVSSLKRRYRRYAVPLEEVRATLDREMGHRTLSDYILEARQASR